MWFSTNHGWCQMEEESYSLVQNIFQAYFKWFDSLSWYWWIDPIWTYLYTPLMWHSKTSDCLMVKLSDSSGPSVTGRRSWEDPSWRDAASFRMICWYQIPVPFMPGRGECLQRMFVPFHFTHKTAYDTLIHMHFFSYCLLCKSTDKITLWITFIKAKAWRLNSDPYKQTCKF